MESLIQRCTPLLLLIGCCSASALAQVPNDFRISPRDIYQFECYQILVGDAQWMTLDIEYTFSGGGGETIRGWPSLDGYGQAEICTNDDTMPGTYTFIAIKNTEDSTWVEVDASVTINPLPPPTSLSISPSTVASGSGSYTMMVEHGANVALDLQYMLDDVQQAPITGWPHLTPYASGSTTGTHTVPVAHCTVPGTYTFTAIKNTLNTDATWQAVNSSVTIVSTPTVSSVSPAGKSRGWTTAVTIDGTNLCGVSLSTAWEGVTFRDVTSDGSSASATLTIAPTAMVGNAPVTMNTTYGSSTFNFEVANSYGPVPIREYIYIGGRLLAVDPPP